MKTMHKRMLVLTFTLALLCSLTAHAAMPENGIMPLYNYIVDTDCSIDINGTKAVMTAFVKGNSNVDKCQIKMTLQMRNGSTWDDVTSWTDSKSGTNMTVTHSHSINSNETYRVKVTFKVWNGSSTETTTKTATP